jgi:Fe-S-cluster containining protein
MSTICTQCGACCASYRVSFYWAEAEAKQIPSDLTQQVNHFFSCMRGTNQAQPHCIALSGVVGKSVSCSIYEQRLDPCKEVIAGDEKCNTARLKHGLAALNIFSQQKIALLELHEAAPNDDHEVAS